MAESQGRRVGGTRGGWLRGREGRRESGKESEWDKRRVAESQGRRVGGARGGWLRVREGEWVGQEEGG